MAKTGTAGGSGGGAVPCAKAMKASCRTVLPRHAIRHLGDCAARWGLGQTASTPSYSVRRRAISRYLTERYESPAMVIGYDTRHNSREYADGIAQEFARADPLLSLRGADTGSSRIVRDTASSAEWRRYDHRKVTIPKNITATRFYDHFGNQIDDRKAALIEQYMEAEPTFWEGVPGLDRGAKRGYDIFFGRRY